MTRPHIAHWPPGLPLHLTLPETNLYHNVEVSAARYPDKPFIVFYDTPISFAQFHRETEAIAGYLQHDCGVRAGDRVLLYMQNSPQWALAYYAILRANAVVVPVNPMNMSDELRHYVADSGAAVAFVAQDLLPQLQPLCGEAAEPGVGPGSEAPGDNGAGRESPGHESPGHESPGHESPGNEGPGLTRMIVATYSDYLRQPSELPVPAFVSAPRQPLPAGGAVAWADVLAAGRKPGPLTAGPDDLCVMPYTSGTTGKPKGCMHTHRSVMCTAVGGIHWFGRT
ncbi:MAG TPA: AMP-binding protein, partial [Burkholderiaceae bacterium]|nr:AMP-binding protein [Burkholderiaceae bacterium]